jgi:hypothetical protein
VTSRAGRRRRHRNHKMRTRVRRSWRGMQISLAPIVELLSMENTILQDLIYKPVDGPPYDLESSGRRKTLLEVFREHAQ